MMMLCTYRLRQLSMPVNICVLRSCAVLGFASSYVACVCVAQQPQEMPFKDTADCPDELQVTRRFTRARTRACAMAAACL
jgi:hypothetical protein